jgi:hypothetical protein
MISEWIGKETSNHDDRIWAVGILKLLPRLLTQICPFQWYMMFETLVHYTTCSGSVQAMQWFFGHCCSFTNSVCYTTSLLPVFWLFFWGFTTLSTCLEAENSQTFFSPSGPLRLWIMQTLHHVHNFTQFLGKRAHHHTTDCQIKNKKQVAVVHYSAVVGQHYIIQIGNPRLMFWIQNVIHLWQKIEKKR